jgi:two-component system OmpR family sensor kinase
MRRFVGDASHELRTPLTSVRGFAELYRQGAVGPDDLPRVMRRIEDEAARMGLLVEDLLLLARLDQQRPLSRASVDLLEIATDAVHDAAAAGPQHPTTLRVIPGDAPVVLGDEPRLRQVLANLVSNAVTHTPPGTRVQVTVGCLPDGDAKGAGWALLEVADEGPGMPPEVADRVFERFYRADESRSRVHGSVTAGNPAAVSGSGLGLAIVAALVAAHGGRVEVRSSVGRGTTFQVLLPRQPMPGQPLAGHRASGPPASASHGPVAPAGSSPVGGRAGTVPSGSEG